MGAAAAVLALAAGAALALAMSASTVSSAPSSRLGERIVVSPQGRTLYALSPETTHHLLCKSSECLKFWPPLTVSSRKARLTDGSGVHGGLGVLRRSGGLLQVTLRGMPLYRFSGDHAKGQVNGQGLKSFGGTWHAVTAAADPAHSPSSTEPASGAPGGSSGSGGGGSGGGYESPGSTSTTTTKTSTTPTSTTKEEKTTPKEEKTAPKEEKTTPKESQAEKEAREKREKEEQEKSKKEYCERYPHYPGCP